jgi:uncharacterized OsmC-like protein
MAESVRVVMKDTFAVEFFGASAGGEGDQQVMNPVVGLHELTPYGMLLAGLLSCTAIVVHTFAQNHGIKLKEVELEADYERDFQEDCLNCETIQVYPEAIVETLKFRGELSEQERQKLHRASKQCPIHKILEGEIPILSREGQE